MRVIVNHTGSINSLAKKLEHFVTFYPNTFLFDALKYSHLADTKHYASKKIYSENHNMFVFFGI